MNTTIKSLITVAAFFLLAPMVAVPAQTPPPAPVKTEDGLVQRTFEGGLAVFRLAADAGWGCLG